MSLFRSSANRHVFTSTIQLPLTIHHSSSWFVFLRRNASWIFLFPFAEKTTLAAHLRIRHRTSTMFLRRYSAWNKSGSMMQVLPSQILLMSCLINTCSMQHVCRTMPLHGHSTCVLHSLQPFLPNYVPRWPPKINFRCRSWRECTRSPSSYMPCGK